MNLNELFLKEIENAEDIIIFAHHFPDGDCVGSEMGLKKILLENFPNKRVYAIGENSKKWAMLLGVTDIVDDSTIQNGLCIVVDHNSINRCGDKRITMAKKGLRFDHHIEGYNPYLFPALVDPDAVSASQIILEWAMDMGLKIPVDAVNDLFTAFLDDKKQYSSSNLPDCYKVMEGLFQSLGGDYELCRSRVLYTPPEEVAYEAKILEKKVEEKGVCYAVMDERHYYDLGLDYEQAGNKSSFLLKNTECEIALLFTHHRDEIRLSARSRSDYSVQRLCARFGGGGHHQAAGATFKMKDHMPIEVILSAQEDLKK